jgi:hypothetical protein
MRIVYESELYHHGIKGQQWGIRRFQNKDGSLTPEGKKRYSDSISKNKNRLKAAKKEYNRAYNTYSFIPTNANYQKLMTAVEDVKVAKTDYKKSKLDYRAAKEKANGGMRPDEHKSTRRIAMEEKYKKQGYSEDQAAIMAKDRIRTERVLAATAALTVTACAAYAVNKNIRDKTDQLIKSGDLLQRIEMRDTGGKLNDVFYTSKGEHDNKRYAGLLGLTRKMQGGEAYLMQLQANGDIRVASKDKAVKVFGDLYKNDSEFRESVKNSVSKHFAGKNAVDINKLSDRNLKKMYDNFNSNLIHIREDGTGADNKFYNKLKSLGYGAIQDINDMKFSGYNAKNPLIVFDNSKSSIMVKSVKELTNEKELLKKGVIEAGKGTVENMGKSLMTKPYVPLAAAGTAATMYVSDTRTSRSSSTVKFVEQYIKEHPNTTLTNTQIAKMYEKK